MATKRAPWKRDNPRKRAHKRLSPKEKATAKARARRAGRAYPNLVDNMRVASKKKARKKTTARKRVGRKRAAHARKTTAGKTSARKTTARKTSARKRSRKKATKDPKGGLTAAGRKAFARRDGSHLKPGVTKPQSDMTPADMRRKGSWAVRFYGRDKLPPLVDDNGRPTRHALSAHAWGEPVPRTAAAARKIAAKGKRLLKRYQAIKARKRA